MYAPKNSMALKPGVVASRARLTFRAAIASLACTLLLSACGGGDIRSSGDFRVDVIVGGIFVSETPVSPGGSLSVAIHAGQSLKLDAGEPVVWTLLAGGSVVNANGAVVRYGGADFSARALNSDAIALDTYAGFPLTYPVAITLVATSTYDSAQVMTAQVLITN